MSGLEQVSPAARRASYAVTAVVVVLAVAMAVAALLRQPSPPAAASALNPGQVQALSATADAEPVALFVGDSYTAGYDGVAGADTFACQVAAALRWSCSTDAQGGTGYVNPGTRPHDPAEPTKAYGARLAATAADLAGETPAWVVVTGGRNDVDHPGARKAAARYFTALRVLYPAARLVVVEPFWGDTTAPPAVDDLRGDVHTAADQAGARWISTSDWLTPDLIGPDKVHPTPAGQAQIADRLTAALEDEEKQ